MAVREAQRKVTVVAGKAGEMLGESVGAARERLAEGLGEGRKTAGKQLEAAGRATRARLKSARATATPRLEAAREKAGRRVEDARKRSGAAVKSTRRRVGYWVAGEKPKSRRRAIGTGLLAGAVGAAAAFFLDPQSGKRRRSVARDWILARARDAAQRGRRAGGFVGARAYGAVQSMRHRRDASAPESDQVLAHKVESELFEGNDFPKGQININAENGVVVLRGQLDSADLIARIEAEARTIQGVRDVENLLHLPGSAAPTRR